LGDVYLAGCLEYEHGFIGFAKHMSFVCKKIAGLIRLVISAAAWVKTHPCPRNNGPVRLASCSATFLNFFKTRLPILGLHQASASGRYAPIDTETPDFFLQASNPTLSYCKSKRGKLEIRGLKSGVLSLFQIQKQNNTSGSAWLSLCLLRFLRNSTFFVCIILLLAFIGNVKAATRTAILTGNWNDTSIWGGGSVPLSVDDVIIDSGVFVTIDNAGAVAASLTMRTNTIYNNGLTIKDAGTLVITGVITMNVQNSGNSTIAVNNCSLSAASITIHGGDTYTHYCMLSVHTGTINVSGAISFSGTPAQARLTFWDAGTLNIGGSLSSGGTITASTGTVNCNGSSAQMVGGYSYHVLKVNNSAGVTQLGASAISILTIGDVTANSVFDDGGFEVTIAEDLYISDSSKANLTGNANSANALLLEGVQQSSGSWGSKASTATNQNDTYFSGTGYLTVLLSAAIFSGLTASQSICFGTSSVTLGGIVSAPGSVYPTDGETVGVTINGVTQNAPISGGAGRFTINFNTASIPPSGTPYMISYSYAGDANLGAATNDISTALTVNIAPSITLNPLNQTICSGLAVSFNITGTGIPAPTYQWRKGGGNISGATSATYTIPSVLAADAGNYDVAVTNTCGTVISNTASLTVNKAPIIISEPLDQTVCNGASATFSVNASGIPAPSYQWNKHGTIIPGATSATFTIPVVSISDVDWYNVKVTNSCVATSTSNNVQLSIYPVLVAGGHNTTPLNVCVGYHPALLTFTTPITGGKPPYSYQWRLNGTPISGEIADRYDPPALATIGVYSYDCVVTDGCGSGFTTSPKVITLVDDPTVSISGPSSVCRNTPVTMTSTLSDGTGSIAYLWQSSPDGSTGWTDIAGATNSTFSPPTSTSGIYYYQLHVNASGAGCNDAYSTPLTITISPIPTASAGGSKNICSNSSYTLLSVEASSSGGSVQWTYNGAGSITAGGPTLTPTYTAAPGDAGKAVTLILTVTSDNACFPQTAIATYTINVYPTPTPTPIYHN